jgi:hypothetical protein
MGRPRRVGKRVENKIIKRAKATNRRAGKTGWIISRFKKAKAMARTGVTSAYVYGSTATGVSPKVLKLQKALLHEALGGARKVGASATAFIQWSCGTKSQPYVTAHTAHIKAWLKFYDNNKHRAAELHRAWSLTYKRIAQAHMPIPSLNATANAARIEHTHGYRSDQPDGYRKKQQTKAPKATT